LYKKSGHNLLPFCHVQSTRLTDTQTDRQKDSFLVTRQPCIQCSSLIKLKHV